LTYLYLIFLIIAPQLWFEPLLNLRVDYIIYPLWFITIFVRGRLKDFFNFSKIDYLLLVMIIWIFLSIMVNPENSLTSKIQIGYIKYFLLFKFIGASLPNFAAVKRVIWFLIFLVFVLVVESIDHKTAADGIGWAGQTLGWADEALIQESGSGRTQWVNIFDGPGVFCVLFTMALPFVVQLFDRHYSRMVKIMAGIGTWYLGLAIYYTGSRGGFLASVVCIGAYIVSRSKLSFKGILIASAASFLIFMMAPAFLTSTTDSHGSAQTRVEMWKQGIEMTQYHPVFGVGKANFIHYTGKLIAHNSAIEVMGETGIFGFFLWLSIITLSFKSIRIFYLATDNLIERSNAIALAISIIGYLASSMFVTLEYETFYFLLALAASLGRICEGEVEFTRKDVYLVLTIMTVWIVVLKGFFLIY
jgi:hypothetical protein